MIIIIMIMVLMMIMTTIVIIRRGRMILTIMIIIIIIVVIITRRLDFSFFVKSIRNNSSFQLSEDKICAQVKITLFGKKIPKWKLNNAYKVKLLYKCLSTPKV